MCCKTKKLSKMIMKPKPKNFQCQRLDNPKPSNAISSASSCMSCEPPGHVNAKSKERQSHSFVIIRAIDSQNALKIRYETSVSREFC